MFLKNQYFYRYNVTNIRAIDAILETRECLIFLVLFNKLVLIILIIIKTLSLYANKYKQLCFRPDIYLGCTIIK